MNYIPDKELIFRIYNKLSNSVRNKTIQQKISKDLNGHFANKHIQLANKHRLRFEHY